MYKIRTHEHGPAVIIREDGAVIPMTEENLDYQAYLEWVAAGNTADEWTPE